MEWTAGCLLTDNPGPAPGSGGSGFSEGAERCGEAERKRWEFQKPFQLLEQVGKKRVESFQPRENQNSKSEMLEMKAKKADRIGVKGATASSSQL